MTIEYAAGLELARKLCAAEDQRDELLAALKAVSETDDDCPLCDRGRLRNPQKTHWPECPFGRARVVIAKIAEVLMLDGPARGAPDTARESVSESTGASFSRRTENGTRPHDQHCVWCDCEEFMAVRYLSLHHLSNRAIRAVRAAAAEPVPVCPECGSPDKRGGCVTCADGW